MSNEAINAKVLERVRRLAGMTQGELAKKASIDKQTIYRLESGHQHKTRASTIEKLCRALDTDPETLAGSKPLDAGRPAASQTPASSSTQINVRLDGALRNSYSLAARKYNVPITRIVEIAPLLFCLAAEASLKWRREKISQIEGTLAQLVDLHQKSLHLPGNSGPYYFDEIEAAELKSIESRNIFGTGRFERVNSYAFHGDYDLNPFAAYLDEQAKALGDDASLEDVTRETSASFEVCRQYALEFAGNDERLAKGLLSGAALINEMPRELLKDEALQERMSWIDAKVTESEKLSDQLLEALLELTPEDLGRVATKVEASTKGPDHEQA